MKDSSWWCAICGEKDGWRAPNSLLVVQTGVSASQAKVFSAHAAPQGLCENLINALKLLANQQKDGDSPIQSIVTGLGERSRKGIMESLRNFIKVDKHCALNEGTRPFEVRRPKFEEEVLRTEESGLPEIVHQRRHVAEDWCGPPLVDADWHVFCQAIDPGTEGREGKNCTINTKKMSRAA